MKAMEQSTIMMSSWTCSLEQPLLTPVGLRMWAAKAGPGDPGRAATREVTQPRKCRGLHVGTDGPSQR